MALSRPVLDELGIDDVPHDIRFDAAPIDRDEAAADVGVLGPPFRDPFDPALVLPPQQLPAHAAAPPLGVDTTDQRDAHPV